MFINFIVQLISWIYGGQITIIVQPQFATIINGVWYIHLKFKNIYLKICVKIYIWEKICKNTCNVI